MTILRYLVTLDDGRKFFFLTEDRARRFHGRNPGSVYGGYVVVPQSSLPPCIRG
jgi:hypothetical protein